MLGMLRDSLWPVLGILATVLTVVVSISIYRLQRSRKELAFGVLSSRRLVSSSSELKDRLVITLDGVVVDDLHILVIGLKNSGNVPVVVSDFEYPPVLAASKGIKFISADCTKVCPSNLQVQIENESEKLVVQPLLMNPGDYFSLQVLTSGKEPVVNPDFRIVGTSHVQPLLATRPFADRGAKLALLFWFPMLMLFILIGVLEEPSVKAAAYILGPSAIIVLVAYRWGRSRFGAESSRYLDEA